MLYVETTKSAVLVAALIAVLANPSVAQEYYPAENGAWDHMTLGTSDAYIVTPGSDWIDSYMPTGPQTSHDFTTWQPSNDATMTEYTILPDYGSEVAE